MSTHRSLLKLFLLYVNLRIMVRVHVRESSSDLFKITHHLIVDSLVCLRSVRKTEVGISIQIGLTKFIPGHVIRKTYTVNVLRFFRVSTSAINKLWQQTMEEPPLHPPCVESLSGAAVGKRYGLPDVPNHEQIPWRVRVFDPIQVPNRGASGLGARCHGQAAGDVVREGLSFDLPWL